ncbi:MAG: sulfur carrier protein ThiS [Janthinobacterium lividum]
MRILVNGERQEVASTTLETVLVELGYRAALVATAVDGDFVPASARGTCRLDENSAIEVLAPMKGG